MLLSSVLKPLQGIVSTTANPARSARRITITHLKKLMKKYKLFEVPRSRVMPKKNKAPPPPTDETVAYWPEPEHLTSDYWKSRGQGSRPVLWHVNWLMQRDARRRALAEYYGPLQMRLDCLTYNGFLPLELRQISHREFETLPRQSNRYATKRRCTVTSRCRGRKTRWRVSRIVFREVADHSKMAGTTRAMW